MDTVTFAGEVVRKGEKAVLLKFTDARGDVVEHWFPKSQIQSTEHISGQSYHVTIPQWLAEDRGVV